jgi:hypothetical protein
MSKYTRTAEDFPPLGTVPAKTRPQYLESITTEQETEVRRETFFKIAYREADTKLYSMSQPDGTYRRTGDLVSLAMNSGWTVPVKPSRKSKKTEKS